ncbi:MAG: XRE family transcriptional regulator [Bacteroidales bacterium]|nr:XRE family transcriptional regulator [Bacteroidales bacterium]
MKHRAKESLEKEPVFIGKIIKEELVRKNRTVSWLSREIHCDRRNIYDIFTRHCIDTGLLYKLCVALSTNFFAYYTDSLNQEGYVVEDR